MAKKNLEQGEATQTYVMLRGRHTRWEKDADGQMVKRTYDTGDEIELTESQARKLDTPPSGAIGSWWKPRISGPGVGGGQPSEAAPDSEDDEDRVGDVSEWSAKLSSMTVEDVKDAVDGMSEVAAVRNLLAAERTGQKRAGALRAAELRIKELKEAAK